MQTLNFRTLYRHIFTVERILFVLRSLSLKKLHISFLQFFKPTAMFQRLYSTEKLFILHGYFKTTYLYACLHIFLRLFSLI